MRGMGFRGQTFFHFSNAVCPVFVGICPSFLWVSWNFMGLMEYVRGRKQRSRRVIATLRLLLNN